MAKGLLLAVLGFKNVAADEFQDWYDTEHLPERARIAGFLTASAGSAPTGHRYRWRRTILRQSVCSLLPPTRRSAGRTCRRGRSVSRHSASASCASRASKRCRAIRWRLRTRGPCCSMP